MGMRTTGGLLLTTLLLGGCSLFGGGAGAPQPAPSPDRPGRGGGDEGPSDYADLISGDVRTDEGALTVHVSDGDYLLEVPARLLGRDFLLITRIAGVPGTSAASCRRAPASPNR